MTGAFDDEELDDLAATITADWLAKFPPRTALDADDLAVAATLMSKAEVERLSQLRPGERFFPQRPKRSLGVRTTRLVRYFFIPALPGVYTSFTGWSFEAIDNRGRRKRLFQGPLSETNAVFCIRALEKAGYRVELLVTDTMKRAGITTGPVASVAAVADKTERAASLVSHPSPIAPGRPPAKPVQDRSRRFAMMEQLKGFKR